MISAFVKAFNILKDIGDSIKNTFDTVIAFLSVFPPWLVALITVTFGVLLAILVMKIIKTVLDAIPLA